MFLKKDAIIFINDSKRVYSDDAGKGVCKDISFDCVVMSKGNFRNITDVPLNYSGEKKFTINYE